MRLKIVTPYLLLILLGFSGCTILENLDEITLLGEYSREKDNQHRFVKSVDDHYDALSMAVDNGSIKDYQDQTSFVHTFGEPILKKDLNDGKQRWLYRHAVYRLAKDKVYVYFDQHGKTIKWEKLPCPKFF